MGVGVKTTRLLCHSVMSRRPTPVQPGSGSEEGLAACSRAEGSGMVECPYEIVVLSRMAPRAPSAGTPHGAAES